MSINPNSPVPIYQQIGDYVRRSVAAGVYRPGEVIPSLRAMALELRVNPNTVQRAYEALEREGLVRARKGVGLFVTKNGAASAQSRTEAMVRSAFEQGIHAARAASVPAPRIRAIFEGALADADNTKE